MCFVRLTLRLLRLFLQFISLFVCRFPPLHLERHSLTAVYTLSFLVGPAGWRPNRSLTLTMTTTWPQSQSHTKPAPPYLGGSPSSLSLCGFCLSLLYLSRVSLSVPFLPITVSSASCSLSNIPVSFSVYLPLSIPCTLSLDLCFFCSLFLPLFRSFFLSALPVSLCSPLLRNFPILNPSSTILFTLPLSSQTPSAWFD